MNGAAPVDQTIPPHHDPAPFLRGMLACLLGRRETDIGAEASFFSLGVTSLMSEEILGSLREHYGDLSSTLLFEHPNLSSLSAYLSALTPLAPLPSGEESVIPEPAPTVTSIGEPSPEISPATQAEESPKSTAAVKFGVDPFAPRYRRVNGSTPNPLQSPPFMLRYLSANGGDCSSATLNLMAVPQSAETTPDTAIAIIGMSGRFPQAESIEDLWRNLTEGRDCIEEIPASRWDAASLFNRPDEAGNRITGRWGGFLKEPDRFDAEFFSITPREASQMDPQQRLFLECAWQAMEHAGYGDIGRGAPVGVFVGSTWNEYSSLSYEHGHLKERYAGPGSLYWAIANRVSYFMDFTGPSLTVDTACSASLAAVHLACQAILSGDCAMALAGGVNLSLSPAKYIFLSQGGFLSSDGRCRSFNAEGNGYVPAEGVCAVVLKRLDQALADGDCIHGVLRASALNHGGKATGFTVPDPHAQARLVKIALARAGLSPEHIGYVEAHGTGTALGDPIEIKGLSLAFEGAPVAKQSCLLGSVKSNIGHLEAAAGIAGLIKVLLSMRHGRIPANLHAEPPNPRIDFRNSPFRLVTESTPWPLRNGRPAAACVSSFGAGGANAHVIVEPPPERPAAAPNPGEPALIVLSAPSPERLRAAAAKLRDYLAEAPLPALRDIAYTLQVGRKPMAYRAALIAGSLPELRERLGELVEIGADGLYVFAGKAEATDGNAFPEQFVGRAGTHARHGLAETDGVGHGNTCPTYGGTIPTIGELAGLASRWVRGSRVDWQSFYPDDMPRRVALPVIEFHGERYWLTDGDLESRSARPAPTAPRPPEPAAETPPPPAAKPAPRPAMSRDEIKTKIKDRLAGVIYLDPERIDDHKAFSDLGLDSVFMVEVVKKLNQALGLTLTTTQLYDHPSVGALTDYAYATLNPPGSATAPKTIGPIESEYAGNEVCRPGLSPAYIAPIPTAPAADGPIKLRQTFLAEPAAPPPTRHDNASHKLRLKDKDTIPLSPLGEGWGEGVQNPATANPIQSNGTIPLSPLGEGSKDNKSPNWIPSPQPSPKGEREQTVTTDIAVIGMAGRFPGAGDVAEFWSNIAAGRDCVTEVPPERWNPRDYFDPDPAAAGKTLSRWGGFLADIDKFDSLFFNISPAEAELMDPQQRLFLEEAWHALEDAGYARDRAALSRCGVYVGVTDAEYQDIIRRSGTEANPAQVLTGNSHAILAARIAYFLNLRGPTVTVQTACSSSLVAVHMACRSLIDGEAELMVAGGVQLYLGAEPYVFMSKAGMLSPEGRCKTFDQAADGFVPGEAVAAVVLKRLDAALRDGDPIHGVIKGTAINQDGKTNGITAPSSTAQQELLTGLYRRFGLDPDSLGYVEAHGTGTALGDPIEFHALTEAFRAFTGRRQFCALGSVKTNIGHASSSAGVAGLIKLLGALKNETLPPSLHYRAPNPQIDFESSPFYVNTEARPWPVPTGTPRRAAVSSFGFSGTNCHLVAEEAPPTPPASAESGSQLVVLSAKTGEALWTRARQLADWLRGAGRDAGLADIAYTLGTARQHFPERWATVAGSRAELLDRLEHFLSGETAPATSRLASLETDSLEAWAEHYRAGREVDWDAVFAGRTARRISLPLYPFARIRHWVEIRRQTTAAGGTSGRWFHPDSPCVTDHRVNGSGIVPGAELLGLALQAARPALAQRDKEERLVFQDVAWPQALTVGESVRAQVDLFPADDAVRFNIWTGDEAGRRRVHAEGWLARVADAPAARVDVHAIRGRCFRSLDASTFYAMVGDAGLAYGPALRGLGEIHYRDGEALARLTPPAPLEGGGGWSTAVLDSALQAVIPLFEHDAAGLRGLPLPQVLGRLILRRPLSEAALVWARRSSKDIAAPGAGLFDLSLLDEAGGSVAEIADFLARETGRAYLRPVWEAAPRPESPPSPAAVLIVDEGGPMAADIRRRCPEATVLRLDGAAVPAREDFRAPLAEHILWLAHGGRSPKWRLAALTHLAQALFERPGHAPVRLAYGFGAVAEDELPALQAVGAWCRTARLENPAFLFKAVDLGADPARAAERLLGEFQAGTDSEIEVRYREDRREVRRLEAVPSARNAAPAVGLRDDGVYLITGGLGGLGRIVARHVAAQPGRKLVLAGRTPPTGEAARWLDSLGDRALFVTADISQREDVARLLAQAKQAFGRVDGIFHLAGATRDSFLLRKKDAEIRAVLAPKLRGAAHLDAATRAEPLDFFCLFSSIAGLLGNVGQADYAYANSFLDYFAERRETLRERGLRSGRTLSIAWPLWAAGGMGVGEEQQTWSEQTLGTRALGTAAGLDMLDWALAAPYPVILPLEGSADKILRAIRQPAAPRPEAPAPAAEVGPGAVDQATLARRTSDFLRGLFAEVAKLSPQDIDPREPLEKYGIDSLTIIAINRKLEARFGRLSKTLFFEHQNLAGITGYFLDRHRETLLAMPEIGAGLDFPGHPSVVGRACIPCPTLPDRTNNVGHEYMPDLRVLGVNGPEIATRSAPAEDKIAIIGLAGRYPQAADLDEFWQNLSQGRDCVTEIPADRWHQARHFSADPTAGRWGGFLDGVDRFDPLFFHISPAEAELMDPQERLFLRTAWETLENAAHTRHSLSGERVGVFVGAMYGHYQLYGMEPGAAGGELPNSSFASIANRVSYFLGLSGPSMAIDTMCSSSLTAIHLACRSLLNGDCTLALAGGVNLSLHPYKYRLLQQGKFASSDGRCRSFGAGGDGYVPGEGVGAVLLKPLSRALADGDIIHGVILGSALNHGGKTNGYTVPNPVAQEDLIRRALEAAGVPPASLSYVEAHGTGTALGDPIELTGLRKAFESSGTAERSCAIGSVKSNIGHLEAAAGIAGLTKLLLQMRHKTLAPSLHSDELNPHLDFTGSPFFVQRRLEPWQPHGLAGEILPRRAGLSSFGAGGANAHIIVEESPEPGVSPAPDAGHPELFLLSARDKAGLRRQAEQLRAYLEQHRADGALPPLGDVAYTLQVGRESMAERLAIVASGLDALLDGLDAFLAGRAGLGGVFAGSPPAQAGEPLFDDSPEDRAYLDGLLHGGHLAKLAKLWIQGAGIDWALLKRNRPARRIPLPTYPFAEDRYWLPAASATPPLTGTRLHPLLDANVSTLREQAFVRTFRPDEACLRDHVVAGRAMLPGSAHLEMVRAGAALAGGQKVASLRGVTWLNPLVVAAETEARLVLTPENDGTIAFAITAGSEADLCSRGQVVFDVGENAAPPRLDLAAIRARCPRHQDGAAAYEGFRAMGLAYGPGYRVTQEVHGGGREALARLRLPPAAEPWPLEGVHPSLLDGALRASMGIAALAAASRPLIPFALREMRLFGAVPGDQPVYAHARLAEGADPAQIGQALTLNITLADETGRVLAELRDYLPRYWTESDTAAPRAMRFYAPRWVAAPAPLQAPATEPDSALLILDHAARFDAADLAWLGEATGFGRIVQVSAGAGFAKLADDRYALDFGEAADYLALLATLSGLGSRRFTTLHLLGCGTAATSDRPTRFSKPSRPWSPPDAHLESALASLVALRQAAAECPVLGAGKLHCLSVFAAPGPDQPPVHQASRGFANSLARDQRFALRTLEVDAAALAGHDLPRILAEALRGGDKPEMACIAGEWRSKRHFPLDAAAMSESSGTALKERGVYLITGGLGGLGLIFARYLARQHRARLVLMGRSPAAGREEALHELRALGGESVYVQGDVSHYPDVVAAVDGARETYGTLDGVLHCAGLPGGTQPSGDWGEFAKTLEPKLRGTLNLDRATASERLDVFLLFSSISAVIGDFGGGDYAAGNSFLDAFAVWREDLRARGQRSGRTLSLGWPLWQAGGMSLSERDAKVYFDYAGLDALSEEQGLRAFEQALASDEPHILMAAGDAGRIQRLLGMAADSGAGGSGFSPTIPSGPAGSRAEARPTANGPTGANRDDRNPDSGLDEKIQDYLAVLIAEVTKLPRQHIDPDENYEVFGLDSVKIMAINDRLRRDLGELPQTLLFEYITLRRLAAHLGRTCGERLAALLAAPSTPEGAGPATAAAPSARAAASIHPQRFAPALASNGPDDIAIIGLAGRYPQADSLDDFWRNLASGQDCVTRMPEARWADFAAGLTQAEKSSMARPWGGFVNGVDRFDPLLFNLSPKEAAHLDPQERLFLETAWHTLEDAGYTRAALAEQTVGVFVGVMWGQYQLFGVGRDWTQTHERSRPSSSYAAVANRVSYHFNFTGPSVAVDSLCSSSLTAIHMACAAIQRGDCALALAGGVNVSIHPYKYQQLGSMSLLSSDGRCRSFGAGGDGYVPGEGVGAVLLKPLSAALRDGDSVYAVIKATRLNHGGKTGGFTVPNPVAQGRLIREAMDRARIDPASLGYLEAHGTGTALGDPIEFAGLLRAFGESADQRSRCAVGSVKSNIGHLEGAAGIAGITKVLLQMRHRRLVPSIHSDELNAAIAWDDSPFVLQRTLADWQPGDGRRRAGVSSFGAGGANAHVILEEFAAPLPEPAPIPGPKLAVLSARTSERLRALASQLADFLAERAADETDPARRFERLVYTLQTGREAMEERLAVVADSLDDFRAKLDAFLEGRPAADVVTGSARKDAAPSAPETASLRDLARFWVAGGRVEWRRFYPAGAPQRLSLPGYPFARQRCWLDFAPPAVHASIPFDDAQHERSPSPTPEAGYFLPHWLPINSQLSGETPAPSRLAATHAVLFPAPMRTLTETWADGLPGTVVHWQYGEEDFQAGAPVDCLWFLSGPDSGEDALLALFRLVQKLAERGGARRALRLHILTGGAYGFGGDGVPDPWMAALTGLAAVIAREYPAWTVRCLDLPQADRDGWADVDAGRLAGDMEAVGPAFRPLLARDGLLWQRRLARLDSDAPRRSVFRDGGVYLIAGGAGEVGYALSRLLAERFRARLVWLGRRALDSRIQARLESIRALGGEAVYLSADVSEIPANLALVLNKASAAFGKIHGVIHAAMVMSDAALAGTDESSFRAILAPKTAGSIHLAEAVRDLDLDFQVFFSSIQSFVGDKRQAAYAAGSAFLDGYAARLDAETSHPVRAINWGYWAVGNAADGAVTSHLDVLGYGMLSAEEGLAAIETALALPAPQLVAVKAEPQVLHAMGVLDGAALAVAPSAAPPLFASAWRELAGLPACAGAVGSEAAIREVSDYCQRGILAVFQALGVFREAGERYDRAGLRERLGILPDYERLLGALLAMLERAGFVTRQGGAVIAESGVAATWRDADGEGKHLFDRPHPNPLPQGEGANSLTARHPRMKPFIDLVAVCLAGYPDILQGRVPATEVLFPDGSMRLVEGIYRDNPIADPVNEALIRTVGVYLRLRDEGRDAPVRILEIGAGTGGTSAPLLRSLKARGARVEYVYTDLSQAFVAHGRRTFQAEYPFLRFQTLDIERPPVAGGPEQGGFDLVIAANVLHATRALGRTLRHVVSYLKRGGWLIANEGTEVLDFITLPYGLLEGWWLYQDGGRNLPDSPLLGVAAWRQMLAEAGFERSLALSPSGPDGRFPYHILVAESGGQVLRDESEVPAAAVSPSVPKPAVAATAAPAIGLAQIELAITATVAAVLAIDPAELDPDTPFADFGVDSILAVELIAQLNQALGLRLRNGDLYNYASIRTLAGHVLAEFADSLTLRPESNAPPVRDKAATAEHCLERLRDGEISLEDADLLIAHLLSEEHP
jgi:polyketide synthase PksN